MKAKQVLDILESIDPMADILDIKKVIQKELTRQKNKAKVATVVLPDTKNVTFNHSSGGGNIVIESKGTQVLTLEGDTIIGDFKIYLAFKATEMTISYNFFIKGK